MSSGHHSRPRLCGQCGAELRPNESNCWLCYEEVPTNPYEVPVEDPDEAEEDSTFAETMDTLFAIVLVVLLFGVGVGFFFTSPVCLVPYVIGMIPGLFAAARSYQRQGWKFVAVLYGAGVAFLTAVLVIISIIALLFVICSL